MVIEFILYLSIVNQIYNHTMESTITSGYQIEHLTKQELGKLKKMVLGYGNFKKISARIEGMHPNTFRNILDKGYGTPENVQKIRETVFGTAA